MVEFLRKFENRAIESGPDNSILKIYKFTVIYIIFYGVGGPLMLTSLN